jgi:hypothetical protein
MEELKMLRIKTCKTSITCFVFLNYVQYHFFAKLYERI